MNKVEVIGIRDSKIQTFFSPKKEEQKKSLRSSTLLGFSKYLENAQTIFFMFHKTKAV